MHTYDEDVVVGRGQSNEINLHNEIHFIWLQLTFFVDFKGIDDIFVLLNFWIVKGWHKVL